MPVLSPEVVAWLVSALTAWVPPREGATDAYRYEAIARDILTVALDPDEAPLFDETPDEHERRARTALVLASFAVAESAGFLVDVDTGKRRGGGAVCMMQIKVGPHGTMDGWSAKELLENRSLCVRAGLHILRESEHKCHALHGADRFGLYTHGRCVAGNTAASGRVARAGAWLRKYAMP